MDVVPRLMAAELAVLPPRLRSAEDAAEVAALAARRALLAAGADLASSLDARAARFLDPSLAEEARGTELKAADEKVNKSAANLAAVEAKSGAAEPGQAPEQPRASVLWAGNGRGELLDAPGQALATAAKAKNLDLLVYGKIEVVEEYVLVRVLGYDAGLERTVFSWKAFCSPEDPEPVAVDLARRLERWVAGRDFARLDIHIEPRSAVVLADGARIEGDTLALYRFEPCSVRLEAAFAGYSSAFLEEELAPGDRKSVALALEPARSGSALVKTDAPNASILVDSVFAGLSPVSVPLSGKREIVTVYAPGRERAAAVLPASGEAVVDLDLRLDDGLGPSGRVAAGKDEFYKALGWFFLSLPLSTLAWGSTSIYGEAATRSGSSDLAASSTITGIAAGVATGASAALLGNSIFRLVRYIGASR